MIFLDEPTTGLDPQVRLEIHSLISELRDAKRTILLTTHYIEEAERLCDRVAIIDQGQDHRHGHAARDSGADARPLARSRFAPRSRCRWTGAAVRGIGKVFARATIARLLTVYSTKPARTLPDLIKWIDQNGLDLEDIHLKRPTLEDVFIELTGKRLRD